MKTVLKMLIVMIIALDVSAEPIRLSEPVTQDALSETFGAILDNTLPKLSMANLVTDAASHLAKPFQVEARIAKVCQKKGCFFIAQQEEHVLRVSFRDYGFFIPTDSSGKTVTLSGELIQKTLTAEQSTHFNADLKSDKKVLKPGLVYEIVADSIKIPRQ